MRERSDKPARDDKLVLPRLTARQLAYLAAVAQHESIARAAAALGIAAAAVSTAISQVEQVTGVQVFVRRHARGVVLTPAGRELVTEARVLLAALRDMETSHGPARALVGRVDIGCIVSAAPYLLPPMLRAIQDEHPELLVRCHAGDQGMLLRGLENGGLDAAVLFDFDIPSTVRGSRLRDLPLQAVLPADHTLARNTTVDLRALAAEPFVLLDLPYSSTYILSAFAECGIAPNIVHRVSSPELARGLVAQGLGYALLNFCPLGGLPGQPAVTAVPLAGLRHAAALIFARLYRARTPRNIEALLAVAMRCAAELPGASDFPMSMD